MTVVVHQVRSGAYFDSVVLMQLQKALVELPSVSDAGVVMATQANLALLEERSLLPDNVDDLRADDLLIAVRAHDQESAADALAQVDDLLARRRGQVTEAFRPRSLEAAVNALPEAGWVLVSVPGRYAAGVAEAALQLDRHVFLYSDNVPVEDEIRLKRQAGQRGLLVMGPDCGTAIIHGVGLGFANRVRRGRIGLVAASGTGLQAVSCQLHALGAGVSHAIGTGGRDLDEAVGGVTALQALDLLGRDEQTEVIVLVSKPPTPSVATNILSYAAGLGKPVVVDFLGYPAAYGRSGSLSFARNLDEAAELAVELLGSQATPSGDRQPTPDDGRMYLRGLFAGGTLAYQAVQALQVRLSPLFSNVPFYDDQRLTDPLQSQAHTVLDLGADEFTVGRLHPMLDHELRLQRLRREAEDPQVAAVLLDVVLGEATHPDPAAELAPAIEAITRQGQVDVVVIVLGTEEDPQDLKAQTDRLSSAGAKVFVSTLEACDHLAARLARPGSPPEQPVPLESLNAPVAAVNVGLETFAQSLESQGAQVVHVDWRPPAGGDEKLSGLLARMK